MTPFLTILAQAAPESATAHAGGGIFPILSFLIFTPIVGGILLLLLPKLDIELSRILAVMFSLSTLLFGSAAAVIVMGLFNTAPVTIGDPRFAQSLAPYKLVECFAWLPELGVNYHLGVDGMSLLMVVLTGIISPMCILAAWKVERPHVFNALLLLTQGAALGVFLALNFFHWFLFWELSLFPMFFLIKLWGGPNATKAAYQFVIYTIGGSALMLLSFVVIFASVHVIKLPPDWFSHLDFGLLNMLTTVNETVRDPATGQIASASLNACMAEYGSAVPMLVFLGVLVGLAVKIPMFPFHTWLPSTYAEAPVPASMFLTAILSKMGIYGVHRILWPLFGEQLSATAPYLVWLALIGIVFSAYAAIRQTDLKRMVAYSSINHLNYCLLAVFAFFGTHSATQVAADAAFSGTLLQMFNHGLSAAALFFCIGILEDRTGVRGLNDFGGVRKVAPVFTVLCGVAMFSSLGLPGLNGFVSEFMIFRGVFTMMPWAAAVACLGLLGTAIFLLTFWQKVFHGPAGNNTAKITDLTQREILVLVPSIVLMFAIGVWPQLIINLFKSKIIQ